MQKCITLKSRRLTQLTVLLSLSACDWVLSLRNCSMFHLAGAVNPMGKLINCRELRSESDQSNAPTDGPGWTSPPSASSFYTWDIVSSKTPPCEAQIRRVGTTQPFTRLSSVYAVT